MHLHDIGNLYNGVQASHGEPALLGRALYIKGHDPQRGNLGVFPLEGQLVHVVGVEHVDLYLAGCLLILGMPDLIVGGVDAEPGHAHDARVDHETQGVGHVGLEGCGLEAHFFLIGIVTTFENTAQLLDILGQRSEYLQECILS